MRANITILRSFVFCAVVALSTAVQASNYSTAVFADNPIDYWRFAGPTTAGSTAVNEGSNGVAGNGTYNGTVTHGAGLPVGTFAGMNGDNQSLSFSGAGSITGSDAGEVTGNNARTVTAWINTSTNDGTYHDIFYYGTAAGNEAIFTLAPPSNTDSNFYVGGNPVGGQFGVSQYGNGVGTPVSVSDGSWHFVAFTASPAGAGSATFDLYVDGALSATKTLGATTVLGGTYFIGTDAPGPVIYGPTGAGSRFRQRVVRRCDCRLVPGFTGSRARLVDSARRGCGWAAVGGAQPAMPAPTSPSRGRCLLNVSCSAIPTEVTAAVRCPAQV